MAFPFFDFEQDFVGDLRCIPMVVRHRLDTCGVKLKLDHWNRFSKAERQALIDWPCDSANEVERYREQLQALVEERSGAPAKEISPDPLWRKRSVIPTAVADKFRAQQVPLSVEQWASLDELQRFALVKLSRASHENHNFMPAVREFGLAPHPKLNVPDKSLD